MLCAFVEERGGTVSTAALQPLYDKIRWLREAVANLREFVMFGAGGVLGLKYLPRAGSRPASVQLVHGRRKGVI
jgi:hypothetical protein